MDKQDTLFTSEQMRGSGQTDMVALINNNKDRVRQLRRTPHTYHSDPGHAWLEVEYQDLIVLDILGSISGYSYRKGNKVYLEEDADATLYVKALFGSWNSEEYFHWKENYLTENFQENTFVRNLNHFKP